MTVGLRVKWFFGAGACVVVQVAENGSELIEFSSADSTACGVVASFLAWLG